MQLILETWQYVAYVMSPLIAWYLAAKIGIFLKCSILASILHPAIFVTESIWYILCKTRTTGMPAFWGYPLPPHDYPFYIHIGSQVKRRQSQTFFAKISNVWILNQTLHTKHHLKLLDKMCKYEMARIVEDTEWTRFCQHMDRWTEGQGETSIPPFQFCWSRGYN